MDLRLYFGKWGCFKSDHMSVERIQPPFFFCSYYYDTRLFKVYNLSSKRKNRTYRIATKKNQKRATRELDYPKAHIRKQIMLS